MHILLQSVAQLKLVDCNVRIFNTLMTDRLGFATFYTQGGDWGSGITTTMATLYPDRFVKGPTKSNGNQ
jgi:hypothetical protein